jgi:hypothetical protein
LQKARTQNATGKTEPFKSLTMDIESIVRLLSQGEEGEIGDLVSAVVFQISYPR